jgi:sulfotransferase family protein
VSERLPNFLHLGPSKSGSTWLHEVLISHPDVYFAEAKDLYFFSRYFERGVDWYAAPFQGARPEHKIVGEFSQDYLACPEAPERMLDTLGPDIRLMVTLREPADRAFSSFLYLSKHGLAAPTFRDTPRIAPDLIDQGRYATQLRRYLKCFDRKSLHVGIFDDLQADPQAFLDDITDWLDLDRLEVSPDQLEARLPASGARWLPLAAAAKRGAIWMRRHDRAQLVGRIKRSTIVQRTLYKPLGATKPAMSPEDVSFVREQLAGEIAGVEEEFGIPLRERWGWQ